MRPITGDSWDVRVPDIVLLISLTGGAVHDSRTVIVIACCNSGAHDYLKEAGATSPATVRPGHLLASGLLAITEVNIWHALLTGSHGPIATLWR